MVDSTPNPLADGCVGVPPVAAEAEGGSSEHVVTVVLDQQSGPFLRLADDDVLERVASHLDPAALRRLSAASTRCSQLSRRTWSMRLVTDFGVPKALALSASSATAIYGSLSHLHRVRWSPQVSATTVGRIAALCGVFGDTVFLCGGSKKPLSSHTFEPASDLLPHDTVLTADIAQNVLSFTEQHSGGEVPSPRLGCSGAQYGAELVVWGGIPADLEPFTDLRQVYALNLHELSWAKISVAGSHSIDR